jgi:6-phosphogluconolactonase
LAAISQNGFAADDFKPFIAYGASASEQELVAVKFDTVDGQLKAKVVQRERLGIEAAPVLFHAENRQLYVASLRAKLDNGNKFIVFNVGDDGTFTNRREFQLNHGAAHLSFDQTGRYLLTASYFAGHIDVYRIGKGGSLSESICNIYENRDKAHAIRVTNDNRFAYVPYVKDQNAMFQYSFDSKTGQLKPLKPAQAKVGDGTGPRHMAYHPTKALIYFSNEQHCGTSTFQINKNGTLKLIQVCDAGPQLPLPKVAASDIEITADGKFVFVGVRDFADGKVDSIHRFQTKDDGTLTHLGGTPADAIPWGLQVSPSGKYLLVTASKGNTLTAYEITKDGDLKKTLVIGWGQTIRDIAVVVLK